MRYTSPHSVIYHMKPNHNIFIPFNLIDLKRCPLFKDVCHAGSFVKSLAWELRNEEWAHVQPKKNDNISPLPSNDGGGDACCATSICPSSAFISIADLGVSLG